MGNLIKFEWYKLKKDRAFWLLAVLLVITSIGYPLLIVMDEGAVSAKVNVFYQYSVLGGNNYVIKLVPCILAGFFISSEYSNGTMKNIVASGNSRIQLYFAKLIIYSVGTMVISLILPLLMTGASAVYFGFYEMPELGYFLQTIGLTALYGAAFASIMALFATLLADSGKAIGFMLIFFILFDSILFSLANYISMFEPVFNYSVFKLLLEIVNINAFSSSEMTKMIVVPVVTFVVFGLLGSILYRKKEIK
ncbi:ABC transporter permease [Robertmurraya sp. Marseille-Q9965]